jgi:hypothetical protein
VDYTRIYRADVSELIGSADEVLAIVPCRSAFGTERLETEPREPRSGNRSTLGHLLDIDWPWNRIDWDKVIGGVSVSGSPGSWAIRLAHATANDSGQFAVVAGQRLVVIRQVGGDRFELVAEAPRTEVVYARRKGRFLQRGRVVIGFADGSSIAVTTGILFTHHAKRLATALVRAYRD